jgi:hypothetical protein
MASLPIAVLLRVVYVVYVVRLQHREDPLFETPLGKMLGKTQAHVHGLLRRRAEEHALNPVDQWFTVCHC